jgi:hypothetical protein
MICRWGEHPDSEYCKVKGSFYRNLNLPANLTLTLYGHNNGAGMLMPDQENFFQTQPVYRCAPGSPFLSLRAFCHESATFGPNCTMGVRSNGTLGAHGGSGLSAVGGAIRVAEVAPSAPPISHALKIELQALEYYYDKPPAMVWPAIQHDGYAFNMSNRLHYGGSNPNLAPGSLLAVPSAVASGVNTTTVPGKRILDALTGYGGYLVDDTAAARGTLCTEYGFGDGFEASYGFQFNQTSGAFKEDMTRIFQALHIVLNNQPDTIGGGGTPIRPLAPLFCD